MAKYIFKYGDRSTHVYENKGVLKDAYYFNLVDKKESAGLPAKPTILASVSNILFRLITILIFFNYLLLYSLVWGCKRVFSQIIFLYNHFVIYMVKFSLKANQQ